MPTAHSADFTEVKYMEIWRDIKGYEGRYQISNTGKVRNIKRGNKILSKNCKDEWGYPLSFLWKNNQRKCFRTHRLVITAFGSIQPGEEYEVNHIDGNKTNNFINNLEWVTKSENMKHAYKMGLMVPQGAAVK